MHTDHFMKAKASKEPRLHLLTIVEIAKTESHNRLLTPGRPGPGNKISAEVGEDDVDLSPNGRILPQWKRVGNDLERDRRV